MTPMRPTEIIGSSGSKSHAPSIIPAVLNCDGLQNHQGTWFKKADSGDFPGGPVGKPPPSQCRELGLHPHSGNSIPHACRS